MYAVPRMPSRSTRSFMGGVRVEPPRSKAVYVGVASIATVAVALVVLGLKSPRGRRAGRDPQEAPE